MEGSLTGPVFLNAAQELLQKLEGDEEPKAAVLANDVKRLIIKFRRWDTERPEPTERADAVNGLIEVNRKVLVYISKKTRG